MNSSVIGIGKLGLCFAVTLEKMGRSREAKAHWHAYRKLAPNGEWVELAKEFSE